MNWLCACLFISTTNSQSVNRKPLPCFPAEPLLSITLTSDHQTNAKSLHINHSHEGLLEGLPCEKINKWCLDRLPQAMQKIFGEWPVCLVPPDIEHPETNFCPNDPELTPALLAPLEISARFEWMQPRDPKKDGSLLIIAWYQYACPPLMSATIKAQVEQISWQQLAEDFEF